MHQARFTVAWAVLDIGTAGLEIAHVRYRRDLQPLIAAGSPHLQVVRDAGVEAQVSGAELEHPVGQSQLAAGFFGIGQHFLPMPAGRFLSISILSSSTVSPIFFRIATGS